MTVAFSNEGELERHVRHLIANAITANNPNIYALSNKKAVDIVICRDGPIPALFFIETKLFQAGHGRMGIGTGKGAGYQPEIIQRKPDYFEMNLRWIIVDGRDPEPRYLFVTNEIIRRYLAGRELGEKFNNIQTRIFREIPAVDESLLIQELRTFLVPTAAQSAAGA
jgi:hypothetical protein